MVPWQGKEYLKKRRQELEPLYIPNGAIYLYRIETFRALGEMYGNTITPFVMQAQNSIDIDSEIDIKMAQWFIEKHQTDQEKRQ